MSDRERNEGLTISLSRRQLIASGAVLLVIAAVLFVPGSSLTGFLVSDQSGGFSSVEDPSELSSSGETAETDSNPDSNNDQSSDSDSGSKLFGESNASVGKHGSTHEHAAFVVAIDGKRVDFSKDIFQLRAKKAHFEEGNGDVIHKHADGVTIDYALNTLGMDLTENCLKIGKDHSFCEEDGELNIVANGEQVPRWYEISDEDKIAITFNSEG